MSDDEEGCGSLELTSLTRGLFFELNLTSDPALHAAMTVAVDQLLLEYETCGGFMPTFHQALVLAKDMVMMENLHTAEQQGRPASPVPTSLQDASDSTARQQVHHEESSADKIASPPRCRLSPRSSRRMLFASAAEKRLVGVPPPLPPPPPPS